jgi:2-oxoglutarate ferredoxin oxidoreductase subunit beta
MPPTDLNQYKTGVRPVWCPGCGDFGVLNSLYKSFVQLNINPDNFAIVSGIGCSSRLPGYVKAYGLHTVHGRVLPVATGLKAANPALAVVCVGGDGDAFSIGAGHLPHAARRNINVTYVIMDNEIYGLTKGQVSPTSQPGIVTGTTPEGNRSVPMNPILQLLSYEASFVAQGYSSSSNELTDLIVRGMKHTGFSVIRVISPCIAFNNIFKEVNQKVSPIPETHDATDRIKAMQLSLDTSVIYTGVFYQVERPTFESQVVSAKPVDDAVARDKVEELLIKFA